MEVIDSSNIAIVIKNDNDEEVKGSQEKGEYFINIQELNVDNNEHNTEFVAVTNEIEEDNYVTMAVEESDELAPEKEIIVWEGLCRICGNESDHFIQIFSGQGVEHDLTSKIHSYLPIKVSEDDDLPHQVCYTCAATLVAWHNLKSGCIDAQNRLVELRNKFTTKEEYVDDSMLADDNVNNIEEDENDAHNIVKEHENENENNFEQVEVMDIVGKGRPQLQATDNIARNYNGETNPNAFKYMCGVCEEMFEAEIHLVHHLGRDHADLTAGKTLKSLLYECHLCNKSYQRKCNLLLHLKAHATVNDRITNLPPGEEVATKTARIDVNRTPIFKCNECNQILHNRRSFIRHIRLHTDERPIPCDECGKPFRCKEDVRRHVNDVHKKIKRHACDLCHTRFAAKATRDAHRRIHTGEKPFVCDICFKQFRSINLLGVHKRCHADVRPYACSYCEKAFRSKQKLEAHESVHTGVRPYPCDVCGKAFAAKGEAKRHRTVHFDEKPFLCSVCGLGFKLNRYLKSHIRCKHKEEAPEMLLAGDTD